MSAHPAHPFDAAASSVVILAEEGACVGFELTTPAAAAVGALSDTDRVDDLLRQFRGRYGRGSL
jgi:hypothetical protein